MGSTEPASNGIALRATRRIGAMLRETSAVIRPDKGVQQQPAYPLIATLVLRIGRLVGPIQKNIGVAPVLAGLASSGIAHREIHGVGVLQKGITVATQQVRVAQQRLACHLIAMQATPTGRRAGLRRRRLGAVCMNTEHANSGTVGRVTRTIGALQSRITAATRLDRAAQQQAFHSIAMLGLQTGKLAGQRLRRLGVASTNREAAVSGIAMREIPMLGVTLRRIFVVLVLAKAAQPQPT